MGSKIIFDIREHKSRLRNKYKLLRKNMPENIKKSKDNDIFIRLINSPAYKYCDLLLTYVSTEIEVDTIKLIEYSLMSGKKVAVPKCIDGTRNMVFYLISSLNDLETGSFSVLEPVLDKCTLLTDFPNALCIVPALSYDVYGFRLGYGKGYYDRFLTANPELVTIGICYCGCTVNKLYRGRFDVPVDLLITEKYIKNITRGEKR